MDNFEFKLGKILNFNKKFLPEKDKMKRGKKMLEVLNYNQEDIMELVRPEWSAFKSLESIDFDYIKDNFKWDLLDYNIGALFKFGANIDYDDEEFDFSVPKNENESKNPLAMIKFKIPNKKMQIMLTKKLKAMLKTNKVVIDEEINDINDDYIIYTYKTKYPWHNYLFWRTVRLFLKHS